MKHSHNCRFILLFVIMTVHRPLFSEIVDSPVASLSPAERAWLINNESEARQLFIAEIDSSTKPEVPAFNAAFLSYREDNFKDVDKYLDIALTANPKYGPAWMLKGMIEYDRHNLKNSFEYLRKAIKYHDFPELPNYQMGKILAERKKYKDAISYFEDAISDNKLYTFSYAELGKIYIEMNKIEDAVKILEKGFEISHDAEIIYQLATVYSLSGKNDKAAKYYGLFAYLYPKHPLYPKARAFLDNNQIQECWTHGLKPIPDRSNTDFFYSLDEDMVYSVYWGPIRVGELNTVILDTLQYHGREAFKVCFSMDSNPALEFIATLHSDYITIIDRYTKQTIRHFLHLRELGLVAEKVYDYNRENGLFYCRTVRGDGHIDYLEKYLPTNCIDGTSLLFYARQIVSEKQSEVILTTIDETFVLTDVNFPNEEEPVLVRSVEKITDKVQGELHYNGIVGFTGNFQGWFQQDNTHLPLAADFEIWIGRIKVAMASVEEQSEKKYSR